MISMLGRTFFRAPARFANVLPKRHYKMSVQSVKKGQIIQLKDKAWRVLNRDSSSSGRGGAVVKVDLQDIMTNAKANERFKSGDTVESEIFIKKATPLYQQNKS